MIITIQLQSPEEMAWLQPLLQQLQEKQVPVSIQMEPLPAPPPRNYNPEALRLAIQQAEATRVFRWIDDPVAWQKSVRDEWE